METLRFFHDVYRQASVMMRDCGIYSPCFFCCQELTEVGKMRRP